jgi:hypothetical protein
MSQSLRGKILYSGNSSITLAGCIAEAYKLTCSQEFCPVWLFV